MGGPRNIDIAEPLIHGNDPSHSGIPLWIPAIHKLGSKVVGALRTATGVPEEQLTATISLPDTFAIPKIGQLQVLSTEGCKGLPEWIRDKQAKTTGTGK